jgi:putative membrane protein
MKHMIQGLLLAGSLLVGGSALAQSNTQGQMTKDTKAGKPMAKSGMVEYQGFKVPADERALLERLHQVNQEEIQAGKLAQQNSQTQEVKSYGEMLVRDHTASDERVMAAAQKKGFTLAMPKPMDDVERRSMAAERANAEKLQVLNGQPFDSCFLASMVGGHDEVLGKLMAAQKNVTTPELTPVLQQLSQFVIQHRQQAYTLLGRIGPGSSAGVGGSGEMDKEMGHDMGKGDMGKGTKSPSGKNTMDPGNTKQY